MKKLFLILSLSLLTLTSALAQINSVNESFEIWPAPGWTTYELSLGGQWTHSTTFGSDRGHLSPNCAEHWISNQNCNNWLVTPQINVTNSNYELDYFHYSTDVQYASWVGVYISTDSGNPSDNDFVILQEATPVDDTWINENIDLSSYAGQNIYIAFVFTGTWHHWRVDDVKIAPPSIIDAGLIEVVNPTGVNPNPGSEDVIVKVHNYSNSTIDDFDIKWRVNSIEQTALNVTSAGIASGGEQDYVVGQYNFDQIGEYIINANIVLANDFNPGNDTIQGTYQVADFQDAAITKILPEGYYPTSGNNDVIVTVSNEGNNTFNDITINWDVDGNVQTEYSATALNLQPGQSTIINLGEYSFVSGLNTITATVDVLGEISEPNNTKISYVSVSSLWESFEGNLIPPEQWIANDYPMVDTFFTPPSGNRYYIAETDNNYFGEISDTLWTPLLDIQSGNSFSFWVNNSAFYTNNAQLVYKDQNGVIGLLADIDSDLESWDYVTYDISAITGTYYMGIANTNGGSYGIASFDMINSDASIHQFNNDIGIYDFHFDAIATADSTHVFDVNIRNYGINSVSASDYSIDLYRKDGTLITQHNGIDLSSWQDTLVSISYSFTDVDDFYVYAMINFSSDEYDNNDSSREYPFSVINANSEITTYGTYETSDMNLPFDASGSTMTLGTDDLSQTMYYSWELPSSGSFLNGITLHYNKINGGPQHLPLKVWAKQTSLEDLSGGWIPTSEMTLVFNDTIEVFQEINEVYIPFDTAMLIVGTDNLVFQYFQHDPEWPFSALTFYNNPASTGPIRSINAFNYYALDPDNQPANFNSFTMYPTISFIMQPAEGNGIISGYVYDENNNPITGVSMTVAGTQIEEFSDNNGYYYLPTLPFSTYDVTASYFGYDEQTQSIVLNQSEENADFYLTPKPNITISGYVYGSNDVNMPLDSVTINLNGYEDDTTTTNDKGYFSFVDIYGNADYTIEFTKNGYDILLMDISAEDTDIDMGDIILTESITSAYNVEATAGGEQALIQWQNPLTSEKSKMQIDINIPSFSFTNEPNEDVYLGNLFIVNDLTTITSVEVAFDVYENAHDSLTIEIFNLNGEFMASSLLFQSQTDSVMTIDIPNLSLNEDFYAFLHWQNNAESTDALIIDFSDEIENSAYIMYPGEYPALMSDFIGNPPGAFEIRVNTLVQNQTVKSRSPLSYNIYKGLSSEIEYFNSWTKLNGDPITNLNFIDFSWDDTDPQSYAYAIETVYTESVAEPTYSNFISGFTGIDNNEIYESNVQIYPIPASNYLNIDTNEDIVSAEIYNYSGRLIKTFSSTEINNSINISDLVNGTYIIRFKTKNSSISKKFLVLTK